MGKRIDSLVLFQQHSWRVAAIVCLIARSIHSFVRSVSLDEGISSYVASLASGLCTLLFVNWLRLEIQLIVLRKNLPPGDLGYPLVGTIPKFFQDLGSYMPNKRKRFGDLFTENGLAFQVVTTTEDAISWLWNSERKGCTVGDWPTHIRQLLGKGAITNANGKRHRALRRVMEPAFAPKATRDYLQVIDQVTCATLKDWSAPVMDENGKTRRDFHSSEVFKMFALRLFFVAAFGREGDPKVMEQLHHDFKLWIEGFGSLIPYRIPGTQFHKSMAARDRILKLVEDIIATFKAENPPESERAQKTMMGRACYGVDEEGKPMEMEDLKDNILNMIFAGHDTTYASLGTAVHYLCEHPAIRQAIVEEVQQFQEPLDFDEIKNAPVLNAFLAESWRMDPPVPAGQRRLTQPLEYEGYYFAKGVSIAYSILLQTQSPDVYPQPKQFDIQRFLPADHPLVQDATIQQASSNVDFNSMKANYPVFGGGMHACLGSHFAKLEMRILVTRLLQFYAIEERNVIKIHFPVNGWCNEFQLTPLAKKEE